MLQDSLVECRHCKDPECYQTFHQNLVTWKCPACGFTSNSYMMKNTDMVKAFEETLPSLYKDIKYEDEDGFLWYPLFYDAYPKGLVFADGTTSENWKWRAAPYVKVKDEEREKFKKKDGTYAEYKTDINNSKTFWKHQFLNAVASLDVV